MARIRTVKPEFWTSEQVMNCSPTARLLFIGLWNFCDDAGNHVASPKTIKANVFPGDDISSADVQRLLDELSSNELIAYYSHENKDFLHVTGWHHQKIDKPTYKHPAFSTEKLTPPRRTLADSSPPEGNGMEGNGIGREDISPTLSQEQTAHESDFPAEAGYLPNPTPYGLLAKALRANGVDVAPGRPDFREWVEKGLTEDEALAAVEAARQAKPAPEPIPWTYLAKVLTTMRTAADSVPDKPKQGAVPKQDQDRWWMSNGGIDRKGRELGLFARGGEDYPAFKDRIFETLRQRGAQEQTA